ncbi:Deoxycytidylate deaminase [Bienertia sinuspersici]
MISSPYTCVVWLYTLSTKFYSANKQQQRLFPAHFSFPNTLSLSLGEGEGEGEGEAMNSRDVTLISSATLIGALASAIVIRFFVFNNPKHLKSNNVHRKLSSPPSPFDPSKRQGYLSWDDYFMAIAFLSAQRSKDPNRQVGACLVSQEDVILGIGYNGFPRGCSDDKLPWAKKSKNNDPLETKYPYVCHAEVNAILNTNHASAAGQKLYVTMFPCNECAKIIIQSGVTEVIYFVEKSFQNSDKCYIASHKLLSLAGIKASFPSYLNKLF